MNIFAVHENPLLAAHSLCDKHISKMAIESCQLLASTYWFELGLGSRKVALAQPSIATVINSVFADFPRKLDPKKGEDMGLTGTHIDPYWPSHINHPCAIWCRESLANHQWLLLHAKALCGAFTRRYDKVHGCEPVVSWFHKNPPASANITTESREEFAEFCRENSLRYTPVFPAHDMTPFVQCMPEQYRSDDPVESYREYYRETKASFAEWRYSSPPSWWTEPAVKQPVVSYDIML